MSPGNKDFKAHFEAFLDRSEGSLANGIRLVIIDLFPPTSRDRQGIHGEIWKNLVGESFQLPPDKPLTLASYDAGPIKQAYVHPVAVGDALIDMPLFLHPGWYVSIPLESTYQLAWNGLPRKYKRILEASE